MADGRVLLDQWIERMRRLGARDLGARVAKEAVRGVDAAVKKTAAAGKTPLGRPWAAKKDGGAPLAHAAEHITTAAVGAHVVVTLEGPDVFHHKGLGGRPTRQVIPDGASVPPSLWSAVHAAAAKVFRDTLGGR